MKSGLASHTSTSLRDGYPRRSEPRVSHFVAVRIRRRDRARRVATAEYRPTEYR